MRARHSAKAGRQPSAWVSPSPPTAEGAAEPAEFGEAAGPAGPAPPPARAGSEGLQHTPGRAPASASGDPPARGPPPGAPPLPWALGTNLPRQVPGQGHPVPALSSGEGQPGEVGGSPGQGVAGGTQREGAGPVSGCLGAPGAWGRSGPAQSRCSQGRLGTDPHPGQLPSAPLWPRPQGCGPAAQWPPGRASPAPPREPRSAATGWARSWAPPGSWVTGRGLGGGCAL